MAPQLLDPIDTFDNERITLHPDARADDLSGALREVRIRFGSDLAEVHPRVDRRAVEGLKFAELLPAELAEGTLAARIGDVDGARKVLGVGVVERVVSSS